MTTPIDEENLEVQADEAEGLPPQPALEDKAVPRTNVRVIEEVDISYGGKPMRNGQTYDVPILDAMSLVTTHPHVFEFEDQAAAIALFKSHKASLRESEEAAAKLAAEAKRADTTERIAAARAREERAAALRKALEE